MTVEHRNIGIVGAGQLGRMLALAGYPLGLRFNFLDRSADAPGAQVGGIILGRFDDPERLAELADSVDLLTFDVENVPAALLREITRHTPMLPPVDALETAQDRLSEKRLFEELDIPVPAWRPVDSEDDLQQAATAIGLPAILKTRRLGYDGRGQFVIRRGEDLAAAWDKLGGVPLVLERLVAFEREVSLIGVRSTRGSTAFYPLTENVHVRGILRYSKAPCDADKLQAAAERHCLRIMERYDYAGVLTIEFFVRHGTLIANEIAPRVHNSGHWTIEGAITSQFENHIRAILGLPLGATAAVGHSGMVNFLGNVPPLDRILRVAGAHYHHYGKEPRPLRKLGHCTVTGATTGARDASLKRVLKLAFDD